MTGTETNSDGHATQAVAAVAAATMPRVVVDPAKPTPELEPEPEPEPGPEGDEEELAKAISMSMQP